MRTVLLSVLVSLLCGCSMSDPVRGPLEVPASAPVFPYPYSIDDLDNGLRLITVPTDHPDVVSVYVVVSVGSRDEVEAGKSGFAHFFEHMMFRGSENFTSAEQAAIFKAAGADRNAYTTDDYTCYHTTFSVADLDQVLELEADRFMRLRYSEPDFRTEANAILGEYNTNSSSPINRMEEVARENAFDAHTYRHTTMGFLADIKAMPELYDYSREFFEEYYRPDNTTLLVVGDVKRARTLPLVQKHWGAWRGRSATAALPTPEPQQDAARSCHVSWPAPTSPWLMVSFKGPAFSTTERDMAILDVISSAAFSENSELYKKLFVREGLVDFLAPSFSDHVDPYLLSVYARVKRPEDVDTVRREILATCAELREGLLSRQHLERAAASLKYGFAAQLDSPDGIAGALAGYIARGRSPEAVNSVYRMYERVTPEDVRRAAGRYLIDSRKTVTTLSHGDLPAPSSAQPRSSVAAKLRPKIQDLLMPTSSPLVSFRVLFRAGAMHDPEGKEGVAYVTARLLANGGTQRASYEQLVAKLFPMAAQIDYQVDKEMTVFSGTVHRDNVDEFYEILKQMLLEPAFAEKDLERVKANTVAFLDDGLRRSDVEELGKEVLYQKLYSGHAYEHHNAGSISSVEALSVDDVRRFYAEHYTVQNVTLGLVGGFDGALPERVGQDLARGLAWRESGEPVQVVAPRPLDRNRMTIVETSTTGTGIHFGYPISVTRAHPDWAALWLVRSYFGEHRSENSHLYQRLRELRGLNYGDYAYIEYFPRGMFLMQPEPNHARRQQIFQVWIRPVEPANGPFALKGALYELKTLVDEGMTQEAFDATRTFLSKYASLLVQSQDRRLGYALDGEYYGTGSFADHVRDQLAKLTLDDVNRVIRKHLRADRLHIVAVAADPDAFRAGVLAEECEAPEYGTPPAADVLREDAVICRLPLGLKAEDIEVVPVEQVFR